MNTHIPSTPLKYEHTDLIIIGAGAIGLSLALALSDELNIIILDNKSAPPPITDAIDARVFALNQASEAFLHHVNVWNGITSLRHCAYEKMHVWDSTGTGNITFNCRDNAQSHLGTIVEHGVIEQALLAQVATRANIRVQWNSALRQLQRYQDHVRVITDTDILSANSVIGADGAHSWTRAQAGIECTQVPYPHTAIVATVNLTKPHQKTAWQVFLPTGPLAFLPLPDPHQCSVVWSCVHEMADEIMSLSDNAFCQRIGRAFSSKLGEVTQASPRHAFPLVARHATRYAQHNMALVGDAAHTVHPLAGQGMNLGFADAASLAKRMNDLLVSRHWVASLPKALAEYERERKGANTLMQDSMTGFVHLFGSEHPTVIGLRNAGLRAVDNLSWCKQFFMDGAAGVG